MCQTHVNYVLYNQTHVKYIDVFNSLEIIPLDKIKNFANCLFTHPADMKLQNHSFGLVSGDPEEESPIFILVLSFGCNQNLRETSDFFTTKCLTMFCE